jgi:nitrous oxide reductase
MPDSHDEHRPAPPEQTPAQMSRRSVLRGAAGAGAAGLAISTLAGSALASPALAAARQDGAAGPASDGHAQDDAVVVHVRSVRSGEMDVYRGTTHVRVTDPALAARLARASR